MNGDIVPSTAPNAESPTRHLAAILLRMVWVVPGAALLCLAIFLSIGRTRLSESAAELVVTLVYSALIGPSSAIILTWTSNRFSRKFPRLIIAISSFVLLCTATLGTLAGGLVLQWLGLFERGMYWQDFRSSYPISIVITQMVGLAITTFETLRFKLQAATLELRTRQVEQERAYKLLAEARLSSLESRIHPHFLFNTLNSIAALIPSDPKRAEDTVGKLASLLRFSLNANHSGLVPLSQELKIVRDYLEIEKTRFGSRLSYEIVVPDTLKDVKVPPLALQSLVENSVKHVVSQRAQGAVIKLTGTNHSGRVRLEVIDDGPGFSLDAITPEHGLGNLISRIELLFGPEGQVEVNRAGEKTTVSLSFPA
jgi:sensor histidine kinase YesM